jgi:hypothetical protein
MTEETPLDRAHAAMMAAPEDERARRLFLERLADTELSVLLDGEAGQDRWTPAVYPVEGGDYVLGFDSDARLAEFLGTAADFAALPGRTLAELLAGRGLGLGLNLGVAASSMLLPPEMIRWMAEALSLAPAAAQLPERLTRGIPPAPLLVALSSRLEKAGGLAARAILAGADYEDGRAGLFLAVEAALPGTEAALRQTVAEAVAFAGADVRLDVAFLDADDPLLTEAVTIGIEIAMPLPEPPRVEIMAPGSDPDRPPKLR